MEEEVKLSIFAEVTVIVECCKEVRLLFNSEINRVIDNDDDTGFFENRSG